MFINLMSINRKITSHKITALMLSARKRYLLNKYRLIEIPHAQGVTISITLHNDPVHVPILSSEFLSSLFLIWTINVVIKKKKL